MKKAPTTSTDSDSGISRIGWSVVLIGAVATVVGGFVGGPRALLGVGAGSLIGVANLFALTFLVRRLIAPSRPKGQWGAAAALKLVLLLGGVFLLLKSGRIDVLALIIGYATLPLGIVVGQIATPTPVEGES
jgi:hypothetical protein